MIGTDSFIRTFLRPSSVTSVPISFLRPFSSNITNITSDDECTSEGEDHRHSPLLVHMISEKTLDESEQSRDDDLVHAGSDATDDIVYPECCINIADEPHLVDKMMAELLDKCSDNVVVLQSNDGSDSMGVGRKSSDNMGAGRNDMSSDNLSVLQSNDGSDNMGVGPKSSDNILSDNVFFTPQHSEEISQLTIKEEGKEKNVGDNIELVDLIIRSSTDFEALNKLDLDGESTKPEIDAVFGEPRQCEVIVTYDSSFIFNRGIFDMMYEEVYPEISLSGLNSCVFIISKEYDGYRDCCLDTFTLTKKIGTFDFITNTLDININQNIVGLNDKVNGLCFANNVFGCSVNENVVQSIQSSLEGYKFGFIMFYNMLSYGTEPSVECFDMVTRKALVFDICTESIDSVELIDVM